MGTNTASCYFPPTISVTKYTFTMKNGKGLLVMKYIDGDDWTVTICCLFNAKRTTKRAASYNYI